jgi:hypothetical protein
MDDPLNKAGIHPVPWDVKVDAILADIRRRSKIYCAAGIGIFLPGVAAILTLIPNKSLAGMMVFVYFDVIVIASFTLIVYPNFAGAFRVGLAANREMLGNLERVTGDNPTVKRIEDAALGAAADMKAVRIAIEKRTAPVPVRRRPNGEESPAEEVLDGSPQL